MKKIIAWALSFAAISIFWSGFVLAASEPEGALNNVFVSDIEANYLDSNRAVKGSANILNASSGQTFANLGYKIYFMSEEDFKSFRFLDETDVLRWFTLKSGEKIGIDFDYKVPSTVPSGKYVLRLQIVDSDGRRVGYNDYHFDLSTTNEVSQLGIGQESVKLLVNGSNEHVWSEGPSVKSTDKLSVKFDLQNKSGKQISNIPVNLKVYKYNSNGDLKEEKKLDSISIGSSEKKQISYELPQYNDPSSYFAIMEIGDKGTFSPPVHVRWVVEGGQGSLLNANEQDGKLSLELIGSPFVDGKEGLIKFVYKNKQGGICGSSEEKVDEITLDSETVSTNVMGNSECIPSSVEAQLLVDGKVIDEKTFEIDSLDSLKLSGSLIKDMAKQGPGSKLAVFLVILLFVLIISALVFYLIRARKNNYYVSFLIVTMAIISAAWSAFSLKGVIERGNIDNSDNPKVLGQQTASVGSYGKFGTYAVPRSSNEAYYSPQCQAINDYETAVSGEDNSEQIFNVEPYVKSCTCKNNGNSKTFPGDGKPAEQALDICYFDVCGYQPRANHGPLTKVWYEGIPHYTSGFQLSYTCNGGGGMWNPQPLTCEAKLDKCICSDDKEISISSAPFGPYNYNYYEKKVVDDNYDEQEIRDFCTEKCEYDWSNYCEAKECECSDGFKFPVPAGQYTATCTEDDGVVGDVEPAWNYCLSKNICSRNGFSQYFVQNYSSYFSDVDFVAHSTNNLISRQRQCLENNENFCFLSGVMGCEESPHRNYHHSQINWASPVPNQKYNVGQHVIASTMNAEFWCDNGSNWGADVRFKVYDDATGKLLVSKNDGQPWYGHAYNFEADLGTFEPGQYTIYMEARGEFSRLYQGMIRHFTVTGCGDGYQDPGEGCDLGALNGACPSQCSLTCTPNNCPNPGLLTDLFASEDGTTWVNTNLSVETSTQKTVDLKAQVLNGYTPGLSFKYDFYCTSNVGEPIAYTTETTELSAVAENICSYATAGQYKPKVIVTQQGKTGQDDVPISASAPPTCQAQCGSADENIYKNGIEWPSEATACDSGTGSLPVFKTCAVGGGDMTWTCSTSPTCSKSCFARNNCDPTESSNPRGVIEVNP